jgi:PBP1b-binding outer membrane lipoprotein LpoB
MRSFVLNWFTIIVICFFAGCSPAARNSESSPEIASDAPASPATATDGKNEENAPVSSVAAREDGRDSTRKFIRTAELRFRVPDVIKATYQIEDLTVKNDGFVTESNITSDKLFEEEKTISKDSLLIISRFTTTAHLTLRIPNVKLDTTLKQIAPLIEFLDYRIVRADDVALSLLANRLQHKRNTDLSATISKAASKSSKVDDVTYAAGTMQNMMEQRDQATINNLSLLDQISFSTIKVDIYQHRSSKYFKVLKEKNINAYKPGFFPRLRDAFEDGFGYLKEFIIFLVNIWWVILVIGIIVYYFRKRKNNSQS